MRLLPIFGRCFFAWLDMPGASWGVLCFFLLVTLPLFSPGQTRLPEPDGDFCVGRRKMEWIDPSRTEDITQDPKDLRNVVVDVWYPSVCGLESHSPYIHQELLQSYVIDVLGDESKGVLFDSVDVNYAWGPPVEASKTPYPVIVFSPGGNIPIDLYTSFFEHFSSRGFVVLAVSHIYGSPVIAADGQYYPHKKSYFQEQWNSEVQDEFNSLLDLAKQAPNEESLRAVQEVFRSFPATMNISRRVGDVRFALTKLHELNDTNTSIFYQKLELDEVVAMGHSFGGAVVGQLGTEEVSGLKAVINMDGWQFGEVAGRQLKVPLLWITGDYGNQVDFNDIVYFGNQGMYDKITLKGSDHQNFTDAPLIVGPAGSNGVGVIDGVLSHQALTNLVESYIDEKARGTTSDYRKSIQYERAIRFCELSDKSPGEE